MKKGILLAVYVVISAALIGFGSWYANSIMQPTSTLDQTSTQTQNMDTVKIVDDTVGTGTTAQNGDTITVNYVGTLDNGTKFDSSYDRNKPLSFVLGIGHVIQGWDEGVLGMKVGGKRELVIPASLGYGADGAEPLIPPNATLHFTVELLAVASSTK
jgi:peptidylprolyl isomerase